jgi:hypothetical protein
MVQLMIAPFNMEAFNDTLHISQVSVGQRCPQLALCIELMKIHFGH